MKHARLIITTLSALALMTPLAGAQARAAGQTARARISTAVYPRTPSGQQVASLRVPDNTFTPAILNPLYDRVEDNTLAQHDFFARHHSMSYATLGRVSGYYESATWGSVRIDYQASVFSTTAQAINAYRDGLYTTGATSVTGTIYRPPVGCSNVLHHACSIVPYVVGTTSVGISANCGAGQAAPTPTPTPIGGGSGTGSPSSGTGTESTDSCAGYSTGSAGTSNSNGYTNSVAGGEGQYAAEQNGSCLLEVKVEAAASVYELGRDTILPTAANVLATATNEANRVCSAARAASASAASAAPSVDFSIIVTRVEKARAAADFTLQTPGVKKVRAGTPVSLSAYFTVRKAPAGSSAFAEFTVKHNVGVRFFKRTNPISVSTTPNTYRITTSFTPRDTGHNLVNGAVTIGGNTQQWVTAITVTK